MINKRYRFFDHTADFGIEIYGDDERTLFANAAAALTDLITDPTILKGRRERVIEVEGQDWPDLMVNWLRELLYLWNGENQLVHRAIIHRIDSAHLKATLTIDAYQPDRHQIRNEIKAVTYHQIETAPNPDGWRARVIFDI